MDSTHDNDGSGSDFDEVWERFEKLLPPPPRLKALVREDGVLFSRPLAIQALSYRELKPFRASQGTARLL